MFKGELKKGFTLIEILVTVSIIGFLTTIVLVSLNSAKERARETANIRQLDEVRKATDMFYADNGYYPDGDINALEESLSEGIKVYIAEITDNSKLMYFGINCNPNNKCSKYSLTLWDSKNLEQKTSWSSAMLLCSSNGKRLPTVEELKKQKEFGLLAGNFLTVVWYLSSTEYDSDNVYVVSLNTGVDKKVNKSVGLFWARCVRE